MDRRTFAAWSVFAGLMLGLIGLAFFFDKPLGLSAPLYALVVSAVVLATARRTGLPVRPRSRWPLIPLMFFAAMLAVFDNWTLTLMNLAAVFGLGALVLHYLPRREVIDEDGFSDYAHGAADAVLKVPFAPLVQGWEALGWVREQRSFRGPQAMAIGRGIVFTLPLLFVFAVLLGAADTVFGDYLYQLLHILDLDADPALVWQVMLTGGLAWLGCGVLGYGVGRWLRQGKPTDGSAETATVPASVSAKGGPGVMALEAQPSLLMAALADAAVVATPVREVFAPPELLEKPEGKSRKRRPFLLGMIEASIMLAGVDLLFGAFVLVQFAYFFGGQANIAVDGFTYAEYARRGFFELVAVSVLTLGLVLWLDWVTVRRDRRQTRIFRGLAVALVALTGVMLLSASGRLTLYEQAYGLTHLRVYTHVFMGWLAVLFGVFLLALFRVRERVFSVGLLLVICGYAATLNVMNVEQTISAANVDRYLAAPNDVDLDVCYLRTMSVDALPAMLALYEAPQTSEDNRKLAGWWLRDRLRELEYARRGGIFSLNLSRERAWTTLNPMRDLLPGYGGDSSGSIDCSWLARMDAY